MVRTILIAALLVPALAAGEVPESGPVLIGPAPQVVRGGAGNQTDPHVSGSVVSYTALEGTSSEIRYQDLTDPSTDVAIPSDGQRDSLSDVTGSVVVFRRVFTDGSSSRRPLMFYDRSQPALDVRELAPDPGARRQFAAAGGDTVAFEQISGLSSAITEICVASLSAWTAPAQCLTNDGTMNNKSPAVSQDGSTVAFAKCQSTGTGCDIWVSRKDAAGVFGPPQQLTFDVGEEILPDTNGAVVTYASNAANGGNDFDIWFQNVDGTDPRQLVLTDAPGSVEYNANISGDLIAFERELPTSTAADIYVYQLSTRTLFHLRDTPEIDETLTDISLEGNQAWVVWASPDGLTLGHNDVWASTFTVATPPTCEDGGDDGDPGQDDDDDGHHDDDDDGHHDDGDCNHHGHKFNEGRGNGSLEVCLNPGDRPLLGSVSVTRTRGKPNVAVTQFGATDGEDAVLCVYNQQATSGAVFLGLRPVVGPWSFKHQTEHIARSVSLKASNRLTALISGQPGTSYEVRVYGETNACQTSSLKGLAGATELNSPEDITRIAAGLKIPGTAGAIQTVKGIRVNSLSNGMRVVDQDDLVPPAEALGCSSTGGDALAVGVLLLGMLWVMRRRTPIRVRVQPRRRR